MAIDWKAGEHWSIMDEGLDHIIIGEGKNKRLYLASGFSCALPTRLHCYIEGESQYGKSVFQRAMGDFFPRFAEANTASAKAHYYEAAKDPACMAQSIRMFDEIADQGMDLPNQLKALTSQGTNKATLTTVTVERKFLKIPILGLPVVWMNSANKVDNNQLLNRFWKSEIDSSKAQDALIAAFQVDNQDTGTTPMHTDPPALKCADVVKKIIGKGNFEVRNPLSGQWKMAGPRNLRPMIGALVSSFTVANRHSRRKVGGKLVATLSDNLLAETVWNDWEYYQVSGVPKRFEDFFKKMPIDTWHNKDDLASLTGLSASTSRQYANILVESGMVDLKAQLYGENLYRRGAHNPRTSVVCGGVPDDLASLLKRGGAQMQQAQSETWRLKITEEYIDDMEFYDLVCACAGSLSPTHTGTVLRGGAHEKCAGGSQSVCAGGSQSVLKEEEKDE